MGMFLRNANPSSPKIFPGTETVPDFFPTTWTRKLGKKATIPGPLYNFTGDDRVLKSPSSLALFSCTAYEYELTALHMRLS